MDALPSMNVSLTDELDAFVRQRVEDGRNATSSEVVREGLLLLREREREADAAVAAVRAKLARGSAQADRGEVTDGDAVFAEIDALIARRRAERAAS